MALQSAQGLPAYTIPSEIKKLDFAKKRKSGKKSLTRKRK